MAGLTEVAKRAGVSISTASSVLNPGQKPKFVSEAVTAKVREAARTLGYVTNYHARSMKLRRAQTIGVVLDMPPSNATPRSELGASYFGTVFGSIAVHARRAGYTTAIIGADATNRATWRGCYAVQQRQLDGIVVLAMLDESHSDSFFLQPPAIPAVAIDPCVRTTIPSVVWDVAAGVNSVVDHLAELGHRSILWLGPVPLHGTTPPAQREMLFMQRMWDLGLKGASCRFAYEEPRESQSVGEAYLDPAAAAMRGYIAKSASPAFTAVVCFNDATALGAYAALRERNLRIPEDVSVVGFDDTEAALAYPKLTTVRLPLEQFGRDSFALLRPMIETATPAEAIESMRGRRDVLTSQLVVRESTGRAKEG